MRRQEKRVGEPILGAPSFVGYSAALVRRLQVMAALLEPRIRRHTSSTTFSPGRAPNVARYMAALGWMLALALAARPFGPSRLVTIAFILTIYLGYALTLSLPTRGSVHCAVLVAIPMFYFLGGARAGRLASLGFVALNVVIIAAGLSKSIRDLHVVGRPYHYAMLFSGLFLMMVVAEATSDGSEEPRAHLRRAFHR